jgi:integrase
MEVLKYVDGGILRRRGEKIVGEVNVNYKRLRKSFDTEKQAEEWVAEKRGTIEEHGQTVGTASERLIRDALEASRRLAGAATLTQAADLWLATYRPHGGDMTVADAMDKFREQKIKAGLRYRSIKNLRQALGKFVDKYGSRNVAEITTTDIIEWADGLKLAPYGFRWTMGHARSFFDYCKDALKVCGRNPLTEGTKWHPSLVLPKIAEKEPEVLAVETVEKIIRAAESYNGGRAVPAVALTFFAGIRSAELLCLKWEDISLDRRTIKIGAAIAKTRSMRMIDISDNLLAWLLKYRGEGPIVPSAITWRRWREKVEETAGVDWPQNAARHSFASYYLAHHDDAARTALQLGHVGGIEVLLRHYRGLVSRDEAAAFWKITPTAEQPALTLPQSAAG